MALKVGNQQKKDMSRPLSGSARDDFLAFLQGNGLEPDPKKGLVEDGKVGRAFMDVDGQRKMVGWYQCWFNQESPFGRCGDYRQSTEEPTATWNTSASGDYKLTPEQVAEIERSKEIYRQAAEVEYLKASKRAQSIWDQCNPISDHPYLSRKGVKSYDLRQHKDTLVMPLHNIERTIQTLQFIDDDGNKRFLRGGRKKGGFYVIGWDQLGDAPVINYAEGYATAASYYANMGQPVVVAVDAGNLVPVAGAMFEHYSEAEHVIIADFDDSKTGEKYAVRAAQSIISLGGQAKVLMPQSVGDYNDHARVVEGEVMPVLQQVNVPAEFDFTRGGKDGTGKIMHTKENHRGVLMVNHVDVAYNTIKKRMDIYIPNMNFIKDLEEDASITELEDRCIQLDVPHERLRFNLKLLAREHNPVKEWISERPWDKEPRLQALLDTIEAEDNTLKEILMKKWLLGCVAAACGDEGANLEGILVFVGKQALGKTRWMKTLAPDPEWLLEGATLNPSDKDSVKQCVSHWICELGELGSTFKRADIDQLKAFLTKSTDELRLPYDRSFSRYQRRTAFYGSVNEREFLVDSTGNRRFWVVRVAAIDYQHGLDMQQVWAEVKETMFDTGEHWFLNEEQRELLQGSNEMSRTQSAVEDLLLQQVKFDSQLTKPVQMTQLLRDLGIANPRMPDFKEASRVLAEHGVEPRQTNGRKIYDLNWEPVIDLDGAIKPPRWSD
tara:strand:+ start:3035 stop:5197 length:2163 start_codon:yes stop_codon:yes gene_type:complete